MTTKKQKMNKKDFACRQKKKKNSFTQATSEELEHNMATISSCGHQQVLKQFFVFLSRKFESFLPLSDILQPHSILSISQ
jgi:hypothetical protein